MNTHTSKRKICLKSLLLLPLIALTLYGFSETRVVEKQAPVKITHKVNSMVQVDTLKDNYYKNVTVQFRDNNKTILSSKKYTELTKVEKQSLPNPMSVPSKKIPTSKELDNWKNSNIYGVWLDDKRINNTDLNNYKPNDFSLYYVSKLEKNAINYGKHFYQVNLYTNEDYTERYKNGIQPLGESAIISIIKYDSQQKATPEEVAEYNKWAKQINAKLKSDAPVIKVQEVERIEYLFGKLSEDQKNNAIPYPDFSKLPPPPSPETGFFKVNGETLWYVKFNPTKYYNQKGYLVDKNGKTLNGNTQVNASDILPGQYITKVYQNDKVVVEFKDNMPKQQKATPEEVAEYNKLAKYFNSQNPNNTIVKEKDLKRMQYLYNKMSKEQKTNAEPFPNIVPPPPPPTPDAPNVEKGSNVPAPPTVGNGNDLPPPPPPPAPKSPLDHVIEMAKKGATFYYEGKSISSDEAITLLKRNDELNISTKHIDSKEPKVYISQDPVIIKD